MSSKDNEIELKEDINGEEKKVNDDGDGEEEEVEETEEEKRIRRVTPKDFWNPGLSLLCSSHDL
jgi:hypothetical protein